MLLLASVCEKEKNREQLSNNVMETLLASWHYQPTTSQESNDYDWHFKCRVEDCVSFAYYGFHGREFCKKHAPKGTRPFYGSICEICGCKAKYGLPGQKPRRCKKHIVGNMKLIRAGYCHLCKERATHGLPHGKKIFCQTHASSQHVLLTYPQCAKGNCTRKVPNTGMLCAWHLRK